ncbi:MAG TPA: type I DNA topoisomerase, partial [Candidatus Dojkabacteria bacterium]|nr:type I DNA topoisomerase [Candidatus Dojkabacteria bacterium]
MKNTKEYKNLLIVESPAKAKTINRYLGDDFKVMATVGHVIDLPKSELGVDVEKGYKPLYQVMHGKKKILQELKRALPEQGNVYLAMDPDREGEAIAWHVQEYLKLKDAKRVSFHEITKDAILQAIKSPSSVNEDLVEAQKARRVLDRLYGYKLSELLWKKIWYGLSAGRVQSVALRLVVEREEEREAFKPEEFWDFVVEVSKDGEKLKIKLIKKDGKKYIPKKEQEVKEIEEMLDNYAYKVVDIVKKEIKRNPYPPYTTSTLQQSANNVLGFSAKKTMTLAQRLYQAGYITYMRTDSVYLAQKAIKEIRGVIADKYGKQYLPEKERYYKNKAKNAQEAHEAIRPTDFSFDSSKLPSDEARLYNLIWKRAVSSQMNPEIIEDLNIYFEPDAGLKYKFTFLAKGQKIIFDGFRVVYGTAKEDEAIQYISNIKLGDIFKKERFLIEQKFTQPPARYTEASLVKKLESLGIGRPSTYATIISTILDRKYVERERKFLFPTDIGRVVAHFLKGNFTQLVDYQYTANVEDSLDEIAKGKEKYIPFLDSQYKPLMENIQKAEKNVKKEDVVVLGDSDEKCPICGAKMVIKLGKYGKFLSCSRFPECKGMKDINGEG